MKDTLICNKKGISVLSLFNKTDVVLHVIKGRHLLISGTLHRYKKIHVILPVFPIRDADPYHVGHAKRYLIDLLIDEIQTL